MQRSVRSEELQGRVVNVEAKEALEEPGAALEDFENPVAEERGAIHEEQAAGHKRRETLDAAVGPLVRGEVVDFERWGQSCGLTECEGESFAGDGIDGTGGVADEGDVACGDAAESAVEGDGAARTAAGDRVGEACGERGIEGECVGGTFELVSGDESDTDLVA